jgi:hypothetical protein
MVNKMIYIIFCENLFENYHIVDHRYLILQKKINY